MSFAGRSFRHLLLPLLLLIGGCSFVGVAYNYADTAVRWMADDYFDFNHDQRAQFDQGLQRVHAWHRENELPKYAALFSEAVSRVEAGLEPVDLEWAESAMRARYEALVASSAGDLAEVLATMKPDQLAVMNKKFAKTNEKFRKEHLAGKSEARQRKRVKKALERVEEWVGELEPEQEKRVVAMLRALPDGAQHRYVHRLVRQDAFRKLLEAQPPPDKLEAGLRQWLLGWESGRTAEHERVSAQWRQQSRQFLLELVGMLNRRQRAHLVGKLHGYAEQFDRLSNLRARRGKSVAEPS